MSVLGARFVSAIIMHIQVETDFKQGLKMMKYVINHRKDFMNPNGAIMICLMQITSAFFAMTYSMFWQLSKTNPVDALLVHVSFVIIAKVSNIFAASLPPGTRFT